MQSKPPCTPTQKMLIALMLLLLLASAMPAFALAAKANETYTVKVSSVKLRKSASSSAKALKTLKKGAKVTIVKDTGSWVRVKSGSTVGYLLEKNLTRASSATNGVVVKEATGSGLMKSSTKLYAENSTKSKKVSSLKKGAKVTITGTAGSWYQVKSTSGKVGFVKQSQVKKKAEVKQASGSGILKVSAKLYSDNTTLASKVASLKKGAKVTITGTAGDWYQVKSAAGKVGFVKKSQLSKKAAVQKMVWSNYAFSKLMPTRGTATIVDVRTGVRLKIRRVGGYEHADVEPATAADTKKLKKLYGGRWSWDSRAVVLEVKGKRIAAAINGMPHGKEISKTNNFKGQFCLHLYKSVCHGSEKENAYHQRNIEYAYQHG